MKVYIVVGENWEEHKIKEVFTDKTLAEESVMLRKKFKNVWDGDLKYKVVKKEISNNLVDIIDKSMLAIRLDGYIAFDGKQEEVEVSSVIAEDWCTGYFDDINDNFITASIYIKTTEEDFNLSKKELHDKYKHVWDNILREANEFKESGMSAEDITNKLQEKYEIEWE